MGWGYGGGQGAKGAHLKSMGSYEQHAWNDAVSMADLLNEVVGSSKARRIFERVPADKVRSYEQQMSEQLEAFIAKSESQRPAVLRKLGDETNVVCFMVLAIIGCLRARDAMEVRDNYREHLAPGRGNRVTTASMYAFCQEIANLISYEWPYEPFHAMGLDDSGDEDGEGGDEDGVPDGDGLALAEEARTPVEPTPPAQPKEEGTTIFVQQRTCDLFKAKEGGTDAGWITQWVEPSQQVAVFATYDRRADDWLASVLPKVAKASLWKQPVRFVVPAGDKQLLAAIKSKGEIAVESGTSGSFNRVCNRWPEEHLRALRKELQVMGVAMPAAATLMDSMAQEKGQLALLTDKQIGANQLERRGMLEMPAKRILAAGGRWRGEVKRCAQIAGTWGDAPKSPDKVMSAMGYSADGEAGLGLERTGGALLKWRREELGTSEAMEQALGGYLRYMLTMRQGMSRSMIAHLEEAFGRGSVETDLLAAAVLTHFKGVWGVTTGDQEQPTWAQVAPFWQGWWCTIEVSTLPGAGGLRAMPCHRSIAQALEGHARETGLKIYIGHKLETQTWERCEEEPEQNVMERGWTYRGHRAWSVAQELLEAAVSPRLQELDKREWLARQGTSGRLRFLVLGRGKSAAALQAVPEEWRRATGDMERSINAKLESAADTRDIRVRFGRELDGAVELPAAHDQRTALLAGMGWDAEKRQAFEVEPQH